MGGLQTGQEDGTAHLASGLHSMVKVRLLVRVSSTFPLEQVYVATVSLTTGSRKPRTVGGGPQVLFC